MTTHSVLQRRKKTRMGLYAGGALVILLLLLGVTIFLHMNKKETEEKKPLEESPLVLVPLPQPTPLPTSLPIPPVAEQVQKKEETIIPEPQKTKHLSRKERLAQYSFMNKKPVVPVQEASAEIPQQHKTEPEPKTILPPVKPAKNNHKEMLSIYEKAAKLLRQGDVDQAIALLDVPDMETITRGNSGLILARAFTQKKDFDKAKDILKRTAAQYKNIEPKALLFLAHIYWHHEEYQAVVNTLMECFPNVKENAEYYAFLGQAYLKVEKPELALTVYNKLLEINPHNSRYWIGIGMAYQALNQQDLAKDAFEKAARYEKDNPKIIALAKKKVKEIEILSTPSEPKSDKKIPL